ncbi:aldo/keto reductase [Allobranchiibius huperziae]|uniref:Aryl-alcohol dehydrogenase-like predicted oxidoreductase n=1 Tax=Allobranchiibius huperziae TaxID=1874116 RepID=A0A853DP27_9MICO|nr:aldo/keto reductase [Allobranchiibius huperziae]NYJ75895.1 aryl-alcohol dehydrogenase-like predicted oxidoreductase [Allobranchiibius huperziae]
MDTRNLGHTGMHVTPLCLGAMMFGAWGEKDHEESARIIHHALDSGINFIDTADVYSQGESETIVGKALKGRRDDVILATKFHSPMDVAMGAPGGDPNQRGNSRRWMVREVENSLRRLQTDWIDLYQVHRPDTGTDDDETIAALTDLQRAGKIRAFGSSTFPAYRIVEGQVIARDRALSRFVTEQPPYSILARGIEREVLPVTEKYRMGVLAWSPLSGGWLSGRFRKGQEMPTTNRTKMMPKRFDLSTPANQRRLDAVEDLAVLAEQTEITLIELALAFVMQHPGVTSAIIGPRTMEQLDSQLSSLDVHLSAEVLDRIDEIVAPGTDISDDGNAYTTDALTDPFLRRRRTA